MVPQRSITGIGVSAINFHLAAAPAAGNFAGAEPALPLRGGFHAPVMDGGKSAYCLAVFYLGNNAENVLDQDKFVVK